MGSLPVQDGFAKVISDDCRQAQQHGNLPASTAFQRVSSLFWGMVMSLQMLIIVSFVFVGYMLVSTYEGGALMQRLRRNRKIGS
jgi:hypothetical protein